jgi:hypothetical protein
MPAAREDLGFAALEAGEDPIAVELDLVEPVTTGRDLGGEDGQLRFE